MNSTATDVPLEEVGSALVGLPRLDAPEGLITAVLLLTEGRGLLSYGSGRALLSINLALLASLSALYLLVVPAPASALSPTPPLCVEARAQTPSWADDGDRHMPALMR